MKQKLKTAGIYFVGGLLTFPVIILASFLVVLVLMLFGSLIAWDFRITTDFVAETVAFIDMPSSSSWAVIIRFEVTFGGLVALFGLFVENTIRGNKS